MNFHITIALMAVLFLPSPVLGEAVYRKWIWKEGLPKELHTKTARTKRSATAVDRLFKEAKAPPPTVRMLLDNLRAPENVSSQFIYSYTQGAGDGGDAKGGVTMRFMIDGGGELHVYTGDYARISLAIRYDSRGRGTLLWK